MAADALPPPALNDTRDEGAIQLAIDLPHSPGTRINLHLTVLAKSILLFLTSTSPDAGQQAAAMGSFVYAMPDRYNQTQPMSTALYSVPSTLDFATRMAKVLVRRLQKPCYVSSSIDLSGAAGGGDVDEERDAFRGVVDAVCATVLG
ncbi:hypothetical protein CLAFUW4_03044 [Fulvia fulva]|uniref:Uncharacterized protein n=1 Tax=Passalora fulva TaxID=5499 RepID=A0A9Q8LB75_PASFU|nr:uncharacterized protein CLAFUR5_03028 [Fulvia fulva]KAK4631759.1 hypothetical protein CLAFUR4_03037 [Fulvia fulva]KAK4633352.1 hypothetical protein CLAFUR0_03040 [Fulvia fulva]UJO14049.1 hypothetical protein CLAFUR5_03028 [Fulvia fulva]WPV11135.1 hypothetical protein CLAFUW4_03044 [Fulvia fulva]WPV25449.1 hypothetical protein CLAFUW7_03041 [Fulvia fulva]